jgi:hypothetical protein
MNKLILSPDMTLMQALKAISERIQTGPTPIIVDMWVAWFPLTRDVFLVMKKRFRVDEFSLLLNHDYEVDMAHSIGIWATLSWVRAEFDREFSKKNMIKNNLGMWEYFVYELKRWVEYIRFLISRKRPKTPLHKIKRHSPNTFLIISGLIMSLSLLVFIFHFAVSKTYVSVIPQTTVRSISANIIFSQWGSGGIIDEKNKVKMRKIALPVEHTMKFAVETIDPNSATSAAGRITLYNELPTVQALKPFTRFITEDGLVYRTESWVNIPAARKVNGITEIGSTEAYIKADQNDEAWVQIGQRGNIPTSTYLSIPGLKFNRDKVYAKAKENFIGWTNSNIRIITEAEVKKSQSILREQLKRIARTEIQAWLDEENKNNAEDYSLLMGEAITLTGEVIAISSWEKIWDRINEMEIRWSLTAYALIYDRGAVIDYLTGIFREKLLLGTDRELAIHPDTLRLTNVISREPLDAMIKATMEMNTTITYDLENSSNELTRRMKVMIAWLPKAEAIDRLIREGRVHEVAISFSPFWLSRVSSNLDNIEFIIRK